MGVCLVEDWGFRPGGVHSHFLPHNLYSSAGQLSTPAIIKHDETCFPGHSELQPKLSLFPPPTISLFVFKTKHLKNVKCHRAVDHLLLTKYTSFKTYTGEIRKWKLSNETNRVSPPKSKSWNPSPPWVWSFTSKLTFSITFQFLGPCSQKRGSKQSTKCTFFKFISFTPKAVIKAQNKCLFWGDVGVKKWSPFFAFGHDVGRSVLHRETFMIYAHSDANFVVQIRTHFPAIFSDWRSQNLPTFLSLQCMHISIGKVTHKRLDFWTF